MAGHLHKSFSAQPVKALLERYVSREIKLEVHTTTGKVPIMRFRRALREKRTLFEEFEVPPPFRSTKDIFSLKAERVVDQYRRISFNTLEFNLEGVSVRDRVQLRIVPDVRDGLAEIRFWYEDRFLGIRKTKSDSLNLVHFIVCLTRVLGRESRPFLSVSVLG